MMINKRLINMVGESKKYIAGNIVFQWLFLLSNICIIFSLATLIQKLYTKTADTNTFVVVGMISAAAIIGRFAFSTAAGKMSFLSSRAVKKTVREAVYSKLLRVGTAYTKDVSTSEVVQISVEGVEQLETYFGSYLPQFFYSLIAPLTLFIVLSFINFPSAIVLLVCVPLIPAAIIMVQKWAKKLLAKYWGQYTALGDTFLENLQGLTTLKIYKADEAKNQQMNRESENFRKVTMKVLTMQLNSITIMDLVAFGGTTLGVIMAVTQFSGGKVGIAGCIAIILLAADFFIPMRLLGSFFHVAMNGMAACEKIFRLLDLPEAVKKTKGIKTDYNISCKNLRFSYTEAREVLKGIDLDFSAGKLTAIVGESGSGKSTVASILMGKHLGFSGEVTLGGSSIAEINEESLMRSMTYIGFNSYLFKGTVRENLLLAKPAASDEALWSVLQRVKLSQFLEGESGLDTPLLEKAANLSGGQCQRLALARALLHDSEIYIFDEATSNIDVESENDIMEQIKALAESKTVILISHRLYNVVDADHIYVLQDGHLKEQGTYADLMAQNGLFEKMWTAQQQLENYGKVGAKA